MVRHVVVVRCTQLHHWACIVMRFIRTPTSNQPIESWNTRHCITSEKNTLHSCHTHKVKNLTCHFAESVLAVYIIILQLWNKSVPSEIKNGGCICLQQLRRFCPTICSGAGERCEKICSSTRVYPLDLQCGWSYFYSVDWNTRSE